MSIKKYIPNTITCCNLICGCLATVYALSGASSDTHHIGYYQFAFALIILGAVFDFFDGFAARLLHVSSAIGKELDSLADDITFGFAPAAIVYALLVETAPVHGWDFFAPVAFLIAAFSALRLAKFNLDERQSMGFIGLPTPANALFWGSLALTIKSYPHWVADHLMAVYVTILVGILLSCWILVSEVPMFALKFKNFNWKGNEIRFNFLFVSAALLALLGWGGFVAVIILYVILSVLTQRKA